MATEDRNIGEAAPRILVVEDSPVIALAIEEMLQAIGMLPIGPFGNIAAALDAADNEQLDAAVHHRQRLCRLDHAPGVASSDTATQTIQRTTASETRRTTHRRLDQQDGKPSFGCLSR